MNPLDLVRHFNIRPVGLMHVGANTGDEALDYVRAGIPTVIYVEPTPAAFAVLQARIAGFPDHHAVRAVCSAAAGESVTFNVASNNAESSSLFALGNHGILYPEIVYTERLALVTTTVDDIIATAFPDRAPNLLIIDVQGAELLVLRGAEQALNAIDAVYCEVADIRLYEGSCTWPEIDAFLRERGFSLKHLALNPHHWGNALFVKDASVASALRNAAIPRSGIEVGRGKPATQSSISVFSGPKGAGGAVDGSVTGGFSIHTDLESRPWWQVDLLDVMALEEILVFNRLDDCAERAYAFVLKLGNEAGLFTEVYAQDGRPFGGADGRPARISLRGRAARFVRIELTTTDYLHLDAVEVYAMS